MRKALIFIVLKVAEVLGIVFLPYWLGTYNVESVMDAKEYARIPLFSTWICGIMNIFIIALVLLLLFLLYKLNISWTEIIHKKWIKKLEGNLCDTCKYEFCDCNGKFIVYGSEGHDNVIKCKSHIKGKEQI